MGIQDHIKFDRLLEISRTPRVANPSEKRHLATCRECNERLMDISLRLLAWTDNYIWDESPLEPVPESVMKKMQKAAKRWVYGYENEIDRLMTGIVEDFLSWLKDLFKLQPQRRLVIAIANPIGIKMRLRLLGEAAEVMKDLGYQTAPPKVDLLHTYLDANGVDEKNSKKGEDGKADFFLDATKFVNLNEAIAKATGHIIAIGRMREWQDISMEATPDRFYPIRISEDDRQLLREAAVEYYQSITNIPDIIESTLLILSLGAFGVLTPVSLLSLIMRESADKLVERLSAQQMSSLVMPIHPSHGIIPDPTEARFFTATSEFMAAVALDSAGMFTESALLETFSDLINTALADSDISPDQKDIHTETVVRLLYSLVLNSRRRLAYNLLDQHSESLQALQDSTDNARYLHSWAKIYRGVGYRRTSERAEKLYEGAREKEPGNIHLLSAYAAFLAEQGRHQEADKLIRDVTSPEEVDNIYVLTTWSDILMKWGRDLGNARKMLEKACELEPNNPYPLHMLGLLEERQLHFQSAESFFEKALKADPDNIPTLHARGHSARERGHLLRAEELFKRILEMEPDNVYALVELGCVYTERTENGDEMEQKARSCFQKTLEIDQENIRALAAWADLDIDVGELDRAKKYLDEAERIAWQTGGDITPIITTRAKLAMRQDDTQHAEDLLESLRDTYNVVALNLLVRLYWESGDEGRAAELFAEIQDRIGPASRSLNNFAKLLAESHKFKDSEFWYNKSKESDSENAHTHLGYGLMLMDWSGAVAEGQLRGEKIKLAREAIEKANSLGLATHEAQEALVKVRQLEST